MPTFLGVAATPGRFDFSGLVCSWCQKNNWHTSAI